MTIICTCHKCGLRHIQLNEVNEENVIYSIVKVINAAKMNKETEYETAKSIYNFLEMK